MSKSRSKWLRFLVVFSVALTLSAARAQIDPSTTLQNQMQRQDTTTANCTNEDLSGCQLTTPSMPLQTGGGSSGTSTGSYFGYPSVTSGTPGSPMTVYRDNAGELERTTVPGWRPQAPRKPQPLTEVQLLVVGSVGRIVPVYGADFFTEVPDSFAPSDLSALPEIPLEDGDRFIVPSIPSSVGIVGAVYDANSFLYLANKRSGEYLQTAGGPTRNADKKQIFIIRADGSVVSRQYLEHDLWSGDKLESQVIYPGDTIVVPQQLNKTTVLRGLTDWSAVFSQFALGASGDQRS